MHDYIESEDCELRGQLTRVFLVGRWVLQGFFRMLEQLFQGFHSVFSLNLSAFAVHRVLV